VRHFFTALLIACGATAALAQAPARDAPPPGTAAIRGRVVAAAGNRPLAKAEVRAFASTSRGAGTVLTDANGRYEIADLPAGRYTVTTTKQNYVRASYGERRPLGPGTPIEIAAGQIVTKIDFALQRTGAISGRILDEFGDPAPGVQVSPMRFTFANGERRMQPAGAGASTNDLGEYRVFGLQPGQYFVSALQRPMSFGGDPATDAVAYLPTLYPGTGSPSEAQRLAVAPGQTVTGVNMALLPVIASRISGVALDSSGKPIASGSVNVINRNMLTGSAGFAQMRPDGTFTVNNVPPGEYTLRVSGPATQEESVMADVTVSGGDVTDLQIVGVKMSTVRGRIVFDGQDAKLPPFTALRVDAVHPAASPMFVMPGSATAKDDWTFEIKLGAGRTILRTGVSAPGDWRLDRVVAPDGTEVTDSGIDIPAGGAVDNVTIVMTTRHNEITGTVSDDSHVLIRDCVVVFFAQDSQRWTTGTRYFGISRPDAEGVFRLRLPAGDYLAAAFEQLDTSPAPFNDPDVLQQLRDRAIAFSIGQTEKKKLEVRLGPPPVY
jgi:carboxypeptidase family protein